MSKLKRLVCVGGLLCFLLSCGRYSKPVEEVLSLSAENRHELEAVLEYYQDSALKLKAAEFLIANMVGFSVPDTALLAAYRPFYQICDSIRMEYKPIRRERWEVLIDSLWKYIRMKIHCHQSEIFLFFE